MPPGPDRPPARSRSPAAPRPVPPAIPRPAPTPRGEPGRLVRGLPGQLGGPGDAAHDTCALSPARDTRVIAGPPAPREEGSDVQAWTQAALPQEERRQPRQAAERLTTGSGRAGTPRLPLLRGRGVPVWTTARGRPC